MNKYERMQELGLLPTKTKVATYIDNNRAESREEHNKRMEAYDLGKEPIKKHHPDFYKESKVNKGLETKTKEVLDFIKTQHHLSGGNKSINEYAYVYESVLGC